MDRNVSRKHDGLLMINVSERTATNTSTATAIIAGLLLAVVVMNDPMAALVALGVSRLD